jgi:serine/threonine protein phosphatase PrpC
MGTTASALAIRNGQGWLAHVGDSRIYLVRGGEIRQLTEDHSLVASMVREGLLTTQEAENHPRRNVLQRSLGVGEEVEIDIRGPLDLQEGDTFILCSDGLHGVVKEEELKEVAKLPIDEAADQFIKRALERGAPDNVTVIVARVERDTLAEDTTMVDREGDRLLFDETATDRPSAAERPSPASSDPLPGTGEGTPSPKPGRSVVKWALFFVIALGAAGVWLFWSQQQGFASLNSTSSNR